MATLKQIKTLKRGMPIRFKGETLTYLGYEKIGHMSFIKVDTPRFGRLSIFGSDKIRKIKVPKKIIPKKGWTDYQW